MLVIAIILLIISIALFVFSIINIINWSKDNEVINEELNYINEIINKEDTISSQKENSAKESEKVINYNDLKKVNNDLVGWIKVNGTNIDYPYVQAKNNEYYLTHSFKKNKNSAGWIFLDYRNSIDFTDKNNIIYGHARKDRSMFGSLRNILKSSWYKNPENHTIEISINDKKYYFKTFSVYHIKTENYYITTEFESDSYFNEFIDKLKKRSIYNFKTEVSSNDKILTLSTCHKTDEKIVLHAKLIK